MRALREYPPNLEFEVVDLVKLGVILILYLMSLKKIKKGLVVLKNNPNAGGFSFADVAAGASEWGNNCIIELRTPLKELEDDQRLYYEVGLQAGLLSRKTRWVNSLSSRGRVDSRRCVVQEGRRKRKGFRGWIIP